MPPSGHLEYMQNLPDISSNGEARVARIDAFFNHAVNGDDQLRQRVVYALSQIMVVSENGGLSNEAAGLAYYYDLLGIHAFGNFRELMQAVTLNPSVGVYLSMLGNEKPNTALNIRPDENYARELMQLFTIGLVELNIDGSVVTQGSQPVPTYNREIIEGFAHVFTGWTFASSPRFENPRRNLLEPMQAFEDFHDQGEKKLLNNVVLPANQTAQQDLDDALDNIFAHDNVAPFISKQLIQRLVTANPSPAYVARVARVFNNNGVGTKGDMRAVIKAILLDSEARGSNNGKLVEPLNRLIRLWRAYGASADNGRYIFPNPEDFFGQAPLRSPSVFNFYSPSYAPSGELTEAGLVSPEMEITNETTVASTNDILAIAVFSFNTSNPDGESTAISIDFSEHLDVSSDATALLGEVSLKLLGTEAPANLVVPSSPAEYNTYANSRQNLAIERSDLLAINPVNSDGASYGIHPSAAPLRNLFESGDAAIVANVGPLIEPVIGRDDVLNQSVQLPPQLFSHNDQQDQWQTLKGNTNPGTGWAGRMADLIQAEAPNQLLATNTSTFGTTTFQAGQTSTPYTVSTDGAKTYGAFNPDSPLGQARRSAFVEYLETTSHNIHGRALASVHNRSIQTADLVNDALALVPELSTEFPDSPLGTQLRIIARLIAVKDEFDMSRQVFFAGKGGFDTHDIQNEVQPLLFADLAGSIEAFQAAMIEIGQADNVVLFTQSDFGRTLTSNGDGTDHGWGSHQFVVGGPVEGRTIYGEMPILEIGGADDAGAGRIIPTRSADQYAATLARWFGIGDTEMPIVAPNIVSFPEQNLGFL